MNAVLHRKDIHGIALLLFCLVPCNTVFSISGGWARIFWVLLGYALLFAVYKIANLSLGDIGLAKKNLLLGVRYSVPVVGIILGAFLIAYFVQDSTFHDPRYNHGLSSAILTATVLLPINVVLFEELAFRGILPALLSSIKDNRWFVTFASSSLFGLWHILPAIRANSQTLTGSLTAPRPLILLGTFAATTIAGVILYELRRRSDSLAAPIIVHWFLNGGAMIFAALSWT